VGLRIGHFVSCLVAFHRILMASDGPGSGVLRVEALGFTPSPDQKPFILGFTLSPDQKPFILGLTLSPNQKPFILG
jgi:hypothetical protein